MEALLLKKPFTDIDVQFHGLEPVLPVGLKHGDTALRFRGEPHSGKFPGEGPKGAGDGAVERTASPFPSTTPQHRRAQPTAHRGDHPCPGLPLPLRRQHHLSNNKQREISGLSPR